MQVTHDLVRHPEAAFHSAAEGSRSGFFDLALYRRLRMTGALRFRTFCR